MLEILPMLKRFKKIFQMTKTLKTLQMGGAGGEAGAAPGPPPALPGSAERRGAARSVSAAQPEPFPSYQPPLQPSAGTAPRRKCWRRRVFQKADPKPHQINPKGLLPFFTRCPNNPFLFFSAVQIILPTPPVKIIFFFCKLNPRLA